MGFIALVLLVALLLPIMGILFDSPLGRALARRVEGPPPPATDLTQLTKKVDLLESDVDDLSRAVQELKEENQFLQRLIEDTPHRTLPPSTGT
jgi:hypothetical protein